MRLQTARDVIGALGGLHAVCELTGRDKRTVSAWQTRIGALPASTYVLMQRKLERLGYHAPPELWGMLGYRRAS